MSEKPVTREYLDKSLEKIGRMIAKGFEENTEEHRKIFQILDNHTKILDNHTKILDNHTKILDNHTKRLERIEMKLEGVVYRKEFDELKERVETIEEALAIRKKT